MPGYVKGTQQDAHEFLVALINWLEGEKLYVFTSFVACMQFLLARCTFVIYYFVCFVSYQLRLFVPPSSSTTATSTTMKPE